MNLKDNKSYILAFILLVIGVILLLMGVMKYFSESTVLDESEKTVTTPSEIPVVADTKNTEASQRKEISPPSSSPRSLLPIEEGVPEAIVKWRQQAQQTLASGYTAQKAYFAEVGRYTTDLKSIGWQPTKSPVEFKMGFLVPFLPEKPKDFSESNEHPADMSTDIFIGQLGPDDESTYEYSPLAKTIDLQQYQSFCHAGCTASENGFEFLLVMPLDESRFDIWLINDKKQVELVQDGLKALPKKDQ